MKQCFAWWSFTYGVNNVDASRLLDAASRIGLKGVEMLPPELWSAARDASLDIVTLNGHDLEVGFNDRAQHARLSAVVSDAIDQAADGRVPFVIVFAGNRCGVDDDQAIGVCTEGLAPLAERARRAGVTLVLETLNSKVDHPGHQCDHSHFAFEVVRRVDSPGLRVLFDCYHMQIMEGDLSRTIKANLDGIGHVHVAGVPGRRDLDDRQEINWRGIAGLLQHVGYRGWIGHEFIPRKEPLTALREAFELFEVSDA